MERLQYLAQLAHYAAIHLAPAPTPTGGPDGVTPIDAAAVASHIRTVMLVIAGVLVAVAGVAMLSRAPRGDMQRTTTTGGISLFGLFFVVGGALLIALATGLVNTLLGI